MQIKKLMTNPKNILTIVIAFSDLTNIIMKYRRGERKTLLIRIFCQLVKTWWYMDQNEKKKLNFFKKNLSTSATSKLSIKRIPNNLVCPPSCTKIGPWIEVNHCASFGFSSILPRHGFLHHLLAFF